VAAVAAAPAPQPAAGAADPWAPLIEAGLGLLGSLRAGPEGRGALPGAQGTHVETDPASGQRFVRLPLPDPAAVRPLADALAALLATLKR
jgi:hypothetical protein